MQDELFDQIRERCRAVAGAAQFVRIVPDRIDAYAHQIGSLATAPTYDESLHFRGSAEDTVAYLMTLDSVNFGSGYFPHLAKRPGISGYGTVALSLTDRFRADGPIQPDELAQMTTHGCARIFGQDVSVPAMAELMSLFARAWNDLGRDLLDRFHGSFTALVDAAGGSAARLVAQLDHQPLFHDVAVYRGADVPFYKRAQILVSDLALALDGRDWGRFRDLESLTIFADNVVPHVLRVDELLAYDPRLAIRIERGDLVPAGTEEEVEIRACAVHAVELIVARLRVSGRDVSARDLDIALWNRGRGALYKTAPRHRTRTPFY
jgi:hypothetical protein